MTVAELIEMLSQLDHDTRVVVAGYEEGYDDIGGFQKVRIALDANSKSWQGRHADDGDVPVYFLHRQYKLTL